MQVDTVSGAIYLDQITAETLGMESVSGAMRALSGRIGEVRCDTVSGSITLEPGADIRQIRAESVSGSIRVRLPENEGFTARYSTSDGRFNCDFPAQIKDKHEAVYGNGAARIDLSAVSGEIRIERLN